MEHHLPALAEVDAAGLDALLQHSAVPVVVEFWSEYCGPCRAFAPVVESVVGAFGDRVRGARIDLLRHGPAAERLGVRSVPTLLVVSAGREVSRLAGARPRDHVERAIANALDHR